MAHRLISGASVKCSVPHGHNEFIRVFLQSSSSAFRLDGKENMVMLFEDIKRQWHFFIDNHVDHAFQMNESDPLLKFFEKEEPAKLSRLLLTPGDPTTEMLCACLMSKMQAFLVHFEAGLPLCEG